MEEDLAPPAHPVEEEKMGEDEPQSMMQTEEEKIEDKSTGEAVSP